MLTTTNDSIIEKAVYAIAKLQGHENWHIWSILMCIALGCMWEYVARNKTSVTPHDGCVTCHTRHASVTDFRPIWGNTVEVAHMTSSVMYINSHAKGTSLPLARITTMIPLFKP